MKTILIILSLLSFLVSTDAATITVGTFDTKDGFPFGITSSGTAAYVDEYQQIYAGGVFSGQSLITQIAFSSYFSIGTTGTYTLSIGLGITARTPGSPGVGFASGFTTVFSGLLPVQFTSAEADFDLVIPLQIPFNFDPGQGNLLLDVIVSSATENSGFGARFDVQDFSLDMARLWQDGASVLATANQGLVTQFTVDIVPEPTSAMLLVCGAAYCLSGRKRSRVAVPGSEVFLRS